MEAQQNGEKRRGKYAALRQAHPLLCLSIPGIPKPDMYDANWRQWWRDLLLIHAQLLLSNVSFEGLKRCFLIVAVPFFFFFFNVAIGF